MARFSGKVGFGESAESPADSGNWEDVITERPYRGDVIRNTRLLQEADKVLPDVIVVNSISIVSDTYAIAHFSDIKYVEWLGDLWIVTNVEVQRPRLILSLGKVYNGPVPLSEEETP